MKFLKSLPLQIPSKPCIFRDLIKIQRKSISKMPMESDLQDTAVIAQFLKLFDSLQILLLFVITK